jgi:hypothetical protein
LLSSSKTINLSIFYFVRAVQANNADGKRYDAKNVFGETMRQLLQEFKNHISLIAQQLETSGSFNNQRTLGRSEREFLDNVLRNTLDDSEWSTALFKLTALLRTLSKTNVVVLVDEYDTLTSYAVQHGYFAEVCT